MTILKRYWFLAIPVVIVAVFFLLPQIKYYFKPEKEREAIEKYHERMEQSLQNWQNANYVKIEHSATFKAAIKKAVHQREASRSLTTIQRQALATAITQLIYAHHDGTWESYRAFRIPVDNKYVRVNEGFLVRSITQTVGKYLRSEGKSVGSSIELYEAVWKNGIKTARSLDETTIFCTQCWQAVDLETLQMNTDSITDMTSLINRYVGTNVFGTYKPSSNLSFVPTLEELLENQKSVKIVLATFLIQTVHQESYPVNISFYWSSQHRKWLPKEFAIGFVNRSLEYFF